MLYEALIFGFGLIGLIFGYLATTMNKQHQFLISLFMAVSVLSIAIIPVMLAQMVGIEKILETDPGVIAIYENMEAILSGYTILAMGITGIFLFYMFYLTLVAIMQIGLIGFMGIKTKEEIEDSN